MCRERAPSQIAQIGAFCDCVPHASVVAYIRLALPKKVPQTTLVSALLSHDASKKHTKLEGTARATPRLARLIGICPTRGCCRPTSASVVSCSRVASDAAATDTKHGCRLAPSSPPHLDQEARRLARVGPRRCDRRAAAAPAWLMARRAAPTRSLCITRWRRAQAPIPEGTPPPPCTRP